MMIMLAGPAACGAGQTSSESSDGATLSESCAGAARAYGAFLNDVSSQVHAYLDGDVSEREYRAWYDSAPNGTDAFGQAFDACKAAGDTEGFRAVERAATAWDTTENSSGAANVTFGYANTAAVLAIDSLDGYDTKADVQEGVQALDQGRIAYAAALAEATNSGADPEITSAPSTSTPAAASEAPAAASQTPATGGIDSYAAALGSRPKPTSSEENVIVAGLGQIQTALQDVPDSRLLGWVDSTCGDIWTKPGEDLTGRTQYRFAGGDRPALTSIQAQQIVDLVATTYCN